MNLGDTLTAAGGIAAGATAMAAAGGWLFRIGRGVSDIRAVVVGRPERRVMGMVVPAVDGIGSRLARIEGKLDRHAATPVDRAHPGAPPAP
jgi:hypothetical protein